MTYHPNADLSKKEHRKALRIAAATMTFARFRSQQRRAAEERRAAAVQAGVPAVERR